MKTKYNFFNNTKFALQGILAMLKEEMAFRIELFFILPLIIISLFLPISLIEHLFLILVLFIILIAECINSAIEACVDLITDKWHIKAKMAKDCASAGVFFSIILALITWLSILFVNFF
ncbi:MULTISPECIES: diacylglycerol kinase [unclassified Campylobacter]|uniref:diacylglycerol kinase n=1 Tax=unclassified Campylobacter TaxID=2593542 RepID=UPI001237FA7E|nr:MULTISPECIES: diacylglycerol kinase [unclassified Campylobacter]KAA6226034.1 diacylglycerol kinase [Campylobacter sp. LR196d]KAA6226627.1 diacylglycerol kinase [Campylobacter sp. LR286c]KAA6227557.1 diacylglycerol kinase [Campylobacter sp. LR185c]KAA6229997.1 diacylglycerol kinase [Campylobacter sp. LR291e]KAA6230840.1 diacylglycerol kinase [Campylobacter sp. LR264d]